MDGGKMVGRELKFLEEKEKQNENEVSKLKTSLTSVILIIVIVVLVVFLGFIGWKQGWFKKATTLFMSSDYQAVFLDNGLLYFGKTKNLWSRYVTISDVYYFVQPQQNQQPQLVKFGTQEIHQPKDKIVINRDHVLFVEDLKSDSRVVQAILEYKKQEASSK